MCKETCKHCKGAGLDPKDEPWLPQLDMDWEKGLIIGMIFPATGNVWTSQEFRKKIDKRVAKNDSLLVNFPLPGPTPKSGASLLECLKQRHSEQK